MRRVAVLGGGISGLSTAFYLKHIRPSTQVYLFEEKNVGGWIKTINQDGFTFETGPRSVRLSPFVSNFLDIASEVKVIHKARLSAIKGKQPVIYADGKLQPLTKSSFLTSPVLLRTALKNLIPRLVVQPVEDESIDAFVRKNLRFWSEKDADFIIQTYVDALNQGIYSGDVTKLSARSCSPFRAPFHKRYFRLRQEVMNAKTPKAINFIIEGTNKKATAFTFEGGLKTLVDGVMTYLDNQPEFFLVKERVVNLQDKVVRTASGKTFEFDHVISTLPAFNLSGLLGSNFLPEFRSFTNEVPYNSLWTINLGYNEPYGLEGVGYLVPKRSQKLIAGVLYDSSQFPHLKPCLSVMVNAPKKSNPQTLLQSVLQELEEHTGLKQAPASTYIHYCENSLPQFNVGHTALVASINTVKPSWMSLGGQAYNLSGIPNCVNSAKDIVEYLYNKSP
mmetsp:Transcript_631/g.1134  ORF Transcript_631/g.1134 Transcript_631/m.1134 type:complete len:447 (-) Transcript_631:3303-4643(-)